MIVPTHPRPLLALFLASIALSPVPGCALPANSSSVKSPGSLPATATTQSAQLRQLLLIANGTIQELAAAGVISSSELTAANNAYAAAVAALNQYDTDTAAGDQPGADVALAAAQGYLQQLGQTGVRGKHRKSAAATQPVSAG